jgi:hypothetical protein
MVKSEATLVLLAIEVIGPLGELNDGGMRNHKVKQKVLEPSSCPRKCAP